MALRPLWPGLFALIAAMLCPQAIAAERDGVTMPDVMTVADQPLHLAGMATRVVTMLDIKVFVAGLYLANPSHDPDAILKSPEPKVIRALYLRDVEAPRVVEFWRHAFADNCPSPCVPPTAGIARFLASVPDLHVGDRGELVFTGDAVEIRLNDRSVTTIDDPGFAHLLLSSFIGAVPPSEEFKRNLLGQAG